MLAGRLLRRPRFVSLEENNPVRDEFSVLEW